MGSPIKTIALSVFLAFALPAAYADYSKTQTNNPNGYPNKPGSPVPKQVKPAPPVNKIPAENPIPGPNKIPETNPIPQTNAIPPPNVIPPPNKIPPAHQTIPDTKGAPKPKEF